MVLMANSIDMDGNVEDPTIVKLDATEELKREVKQTTDMLHYIGSSAAAILRPPEYMGDIGGVVLEMAGACWVLKPAGQSCGRGIVCVGRWAELLRGALERCPKAERVL